MIIHLLLAMSVLAGLAAAGRVDHDIGDAKESFQGPGVEGNVLNVFKCDRGLVNHPDSPADAQALFAEDVPGCVIAKMDCDVRNHVRQDRNGKCQWREPQRGEGKSDKQREPRGENCKIGDEEKEPELELQIAKESLRGPERFELFGSVHRQRRRLGWNTKPFRECAPNASVYPGRSFFNPAAHDCLLGGAFWRSRSRISRRRLSASSWGLPPPAVAWLPRPRAPRIFA